MSEFLRPWKLFSLAVGVALLIAGAFHYDFPDWDVPISLIMAMLTYLTAGWSMRVILERQWKNWPAMLFATWFTVDGSYWLYWRFMNPAALDLRDVYFPASLSLYLHVRRHLALSRQSSELWADVQSALRAARETTWQSGAGSM